MGFFRKYFTQTILPHPNRTYTKVHLKEHVKKVHLKEHVKKVHLYSSIPSFKQFSWDFTLTTQENCKYLLVSDECSYQTDMFMKLIVRLEE